jgi:hypothetical protein
MVRAIESLARVTVDEISTRVPGSTTPIRSAVHLR